MTMPTDYIFTQGTCLKSAIYDLIYNTLIGKGWVDASSKAATDYAVLTSTGNNGDKALVLNLRDVNAAATNSVKTTNYCQMSYRLVDTYVPGAAGVAGVFGRPALAWTDLYIAPVAASGLLALDTTVNYKVYADKSKIILAIEYPNATGLNPVLLYIGQPDSVFLPESGSHGMLVATTVNASGVSTLLLDNSPDGIGLVAAPYAYTTLALQPIKNPNNAGIYFESGIYYQSATEGIRGLLDGIMCMPNMAAFTGDITTINGNTYYTLVCQVVGSSSFPTQVLLIRTA